MLRDVNNTSQLFFLMAHFDNAAGSPNSSLKRLKDSVAKMQKETKGMQELCMFIALPRPNKP